MQSLRWDERTVLADRGLLPLELGDAFETTGPPAARSDRYRGALVGLGIGNAIGRPVQGRPGSSAAGPLEGYVTRPNARWMLPAGQLGDQAQMALIVAASITAEGRFDAGDVSTRLAAWLPVARTPGEPVRLGVSALRNGTPWIAAGIDTDDAGSLARAVPVGLAIPVDGDEQRRAAALGAVPTHASRAAVTASGLVAACIAHLVDAASFDPDQLLGVLRQAAAGLPDEREHGGPSLIEGIGAAFRSGRAEEVPTAQVTEVLPAALRALAHAPDDPPAAIDAVVRMGGPTGITAALTGAFAGALNGLSSFPSSWVTDLEYVDGLSGYADDLLRLSRTGTPGLPGVPRDPLHPATHAPFRLGGVTVPTLEHAIRSTAAADPSAAVRLRLLPTPADARRYATTAEIRPDWKAVAATTIGAVLRRRFEDGGPDLAALHGRPDADLEILMGAFPADEPFDYPVLLAIRREELGRRLTA